MSNDAPDPPRSRQEAAGAAPRPDPVRVVGGLLVRDGRVLLGRRSAHKQMAPNRWDMLGGHVEPGEGLEQTLRRELQEEAGILATDYRLLADSIALAGALLTVYRVDAWIGEPSLRNDEHVMLSWHRFEQAMALDDLADPSLRWLIGRLR
ncbi:MAG: NUDIX domain-containing protein [Lysobacter sp.]